VHYDNTAEMRSRAAKNTKGIQGILSKKSRHA